MFWYLLNIFIIVLAWLWPVNIDYRDENAYCLYNKIRTKRTCIVGTINWIILSGFRSWEIGNDTVAYKLYRFDRTLERSWADIIADFKAKYFLGVSGEKDLGYRVLEKVFQIFSKNYTVWLIAIAMFFMISLAILIYRYSNNACISYIVYSTLFYSFFSITGHRQTIATALVVFIGIHFIKQRKLIPFLILIAIGYTIHASCICFLPFYWISQIKINKLSIAIYGIAIALSFAFRYQLLYALQMLVGYESFQDYEGARLATFAFLLFGMAIVGCLKWKTMYELSNNPILHISMNAVLMACFFAPLLSINQSFMRVVQYYSLFIMFILPEYTNLFSESSKRIFNVMICTIMIILLIRTNPPYSFVWMS